MLEARNLTKSYGAVKALDSLNIAIAPGETLCMLGANGAGKTTTINLFLGFIEPSSGQALVDGRDVQDDPVGSKAQLAYIPEQVALYPALTGLENLRFFADLAGGVTHSQDELLALLERAGLDPDAALRRAGGYSKGMRQKVGIGVALAKQARAFLLDEPLSGLDPKAANEFSGILETLRAEGAATLLATHDIFRAREVGTRVGIMKAGRLVETLDPKAITGGELEDIYLAHMSGMERQKAGAPA